MLSLQVLYNFIIVLLLILLQFWGRHEELNSKKIVVINEILLWIDFILIFVYYSAQVEITEKFSKTTKAITGFHKFNTWQVSVFILIRNIHPTFHWWGLFGA